MEDNQITDNDKEDDKQDRIELVQRAVEGDKEAFTNLYMLTYSEVYHIVKVFIHNEDTAQDIDGHILVQFTGIGRNLQARYQALQCLRGIRYRTCFNFLRRSQPHRTCQVHLQIGRAHV